MSQEYENPLFEITLNNSEEFHLLRLTLQQCHGFFFFRGHSNFQWDLLSSLDRLCLIEAQNEEEKDFEGIYYGLKNYYENDLLKIIQRDIPNYLLNTSLPASTEFAEWLALIQHYGGKTRLLDFTESFYIALFFATHFGQEEIYSKSAIWTINYFSETISEYKEEKIQFNYLSQRFNDIYKNFYYNDKTEKKKINLLKPVITNE